MTLIMIGGLITSIVTGVQVNGQERQHQAGYYRMSFGDVEIIALSDGTLPLPVHDLLINIKPAQIDSLLRRGFVTAPTEASINAYLIKTATRLIMVDAGTSSELIGPALGFLPNSIRAAGYKPEDIEAILITHIHTDHTGGLMEGNKMVFPNAKIYISKPEVDYWMNPRERQKAPERLKKYFAEAELKVTPYLKAGKVVPFEYGRELFPGITPVATPGHTPGHTFYSLESKGQKMMLWGDIMHVAEVQFKKPETAITFDVDSRQAVIQRVKAYADAARQGYWIAAAHISFPGIGHLQQDGKNTYTWVPVVYKYQ